MEVREDKDAMTYTIGSSNKDGKTEGQKDKERAWDMLKNIDIIIDKRKSRDLID